VTDWSLLQEAVIAGEPDQVKDLTEAALKAGEAAQAVLEQGLIPGMDTVGERMKNLELYVPEVLASARALKVGLNLLRPLLVESGVKPVGKVVIGTVKGDLHDIGKNLVAMTLEGAGFQVVDLGTDVSPQRFLEVAQQEGANLIAMSALLTTTMPVMRGTVEALKKAGVRDQVRVMIGGAAVTQHFADEIGADGYAPDASWAPGRAREILGL
jgi:5-methyltetrahydrofolate--homocysteine methyltransferase